MPLPYIPQWTDPKTNWNPGDGIMAGDLNKVGGNLGALHLGLREQVSMGSTLVNVTIPSNTLGSASHYALVLGMGALFVPQGAEIIVSGSTLHNIQVQNDVDAFIAIHDHNGVSYNNNIGNMVHPLGSSYVYASENELKNNALYYQNFLTDVIPIPQINLNLNRNVVAMIFIGYSFAKKSPTSFDADILHMDATFTTLRR
jgi:hypothetical protein